MFLILINVVVLIFFIEINVHGKEFNVEPRVSCGGLFCNEFENYPNESIKRLVVDHPTFIQRIQDIEFELELAQSRSRKRSLCDCRAKTSAPLVGLNVYNTPRLIVNIEQYKQKLQICTVNLTDVIEFQKTPCAELRPKQNIYRSMCLPKYQNVILNVIKDEQLYLDEFYMISMYTCAFVPN